MGDVLSAIGRFTLNEVNKVSISQTGEWAEMNSKYIAYSVVDSRIEAILDWLSCLTMYQKQQDILSRRHGKTRSWLLMDPLF